MSTRRSQESTPRLHARSPTFKFTDPASAVPALAEGLRLTRDVIAKSANDPDALLVLRIKERQFQDAISAALGLELSAMADPSPKPSSEAADAAVVAASSRR